MASRLARSALRALSQEPERQANTLPDALKSRCPCLNCPEPRGEGRPVAARRIEAEETGYNLAGGPGGSGSAKIGVRASADGPQRGSNLTDDLGNSRVNRTQIPSGHWRATIAWVR